MGYRSDVKAVFVFSKPEHRNEFLVRAKLVENEILHDMLACCSPYDAPRIETLAPRYALRMHCDGWKWYDDESVAFSTLTELCVECRGEWCFLRIGEDADDTEETSGGGNADLVPLMFVWDFLTLERKSSFVDV